MRYSVVMSEIVTVGHPVLAQKAAEVPLEKITSKEIKVIIARMKKALAGEPLGVAIAAPQIGESLRIFVVSGKVFAPRDETEAPTKLIDRTYINPEILKTSRKKKKMHEGCLSVRGSTPDRLVWGTVERAEKMLIRAYDEKGVRAEHGVSGFVAQIFQHEIDHLEGILYTSKAVSVYEEPAKGTS
jgi:peptide deformylase